MFIHPVTIIIILSIVAAGSLGWMIVQARARTRKRIAGNGQSTPDVAAMRERISVLERIVTDPAEKLHHDIENLRRQS